MNPPPKPPESPAHVSEQASLEAARQMRLMQSLQGLDDRPRLERVDGGTGVPTSHVRELPRAGRNGLGPVAPGAPDDPGRARHEPSLLRPEDHVEATPREAAVTPGDRAPGPADGSDDLGLEGGIEEEADEVGPVGPIARAHTVSIKRLSKRELERERYLRILDERENGPLPLRPQTRAECEVGTGAERPCPWISCKHHLYLDVNRQTGSIKLNFPNLSVWELKHSCALDIAARGGITLEDVADVMNLTRERIRQVEGRALERLMVADESIAMAATLETARKRP